MDVFIRNKPYRGPVRALVLDWAGTAVDYGCMGPVSVFVDAFGQHGVEVTVAEARAPMGLMKRDHVRAMCNMERISARWKEVRGRLPDENDVGIVYEDVDLLMPRSIVNHSAPVPGLLEVLQTLRAEGLKIGSTTGYTAPMMQVLMPKAEEQGYRPDSVVCSTDVPAGRPYPWMCYRNALDLEVYPLEAMIKVGDTVSDVHEGLNAGMWTAAVTETGNELGLTEEEVRALAPEDLASRLEAIEKRFLEAGAHYVVRSVRDCPEVVEKVNERLALGERP